MNFRVYKVTGYEDAILSLRMSKGKYYSWEKASDIQDLVYLVTNRRGFICTPTAYYHKLPDVMPEHNSKVTGDYETDVKEFMRLLELTFNNAMKDHKHHTLMKYIDVTFITEGLHRGAQDDLDAHAIAFNNRITRFSTRLAEIDNVYLSDWYKDKAIPLLDGIGILNDQLKAQGIKYGEGLVGIPKEITYNGENYQLTPFGYVLEKYAQVPAKNGLSKDVQRGLMPLGIESTALWKIDLFNLRYVYHMRSKLTKAAPELKIGMEQLFNYLEAKLPVFGPYLRKVYTDSGSWEHTNKVKTVTKEEYEKLQKLRE